MWCIYLRKMNICHLTTVKYSRLDFSEYSWILCACHYTQGAFMFALLFDTSKLGGRAGHKFYVIFSGWCNQYKQNKGILMRCV